MATREAKAKIGLDVSGFERSAQVIFKSVEKINSTIKTVAGVTGGLFVFGKLIDGANAFKNSITGSITASLRFGEELATLAHGTGALAGNLYTMQFALEKGITNQAAAKLLGTEARLLNENAGIFRDAAIKLSVIGERTKGFWLGATEKIAPLLERVFDRIMSFDFVAWGEQITAPFAKVGEALFQAITDGRVIESIKALGAVLGATIEDAFDYSVEVLKKKANLAFPKAAAIVSVGEKLSGAAEFGPAGLHALLEFYRGNVKASDLDMPKPDFTRTTKKTDEAMKIFDELVGNFNKTAGKNRPDTFEYAKAFKNFTVDSLQSIGGGGGVSKGSSIVDVATRQLNVSEQMLDQLKTLVKITPGANRDSNNPESDSGKNSSMYSTFATAGGTF